MGQNATCIAHARSSKTLHSLLCCSSWSQYAQGYGKRDLPDVMVPRNIVHWNLVLQGKHTSESAVVAFVSCVMSGLCASPEVIGYTLCFRHVDSSVVHHITQEYDCVGGKARSRPPAPPHIQVHNELAERHEPGGTTRIRAVVENLRVSDEQNTRCFTRSTD